MRFRLSNVYDCQTLDPSSWELGLTVVLDSIIGSLKRTAGEGCQFPPLLKYGHPW